MITAILRTGFAITGPSGTHGADLTDVPANEGHHGDPGRGAAGPFLGDAGSRATHGTRYAAARPVAGGLPGRVLRHGLFLGRGAALLAGARGLLDRCGVPGRVH